MDPAPPEVVEEDDPPEADLGPVVPPGTRLELPFKPPGCAYTVRAPCSGCSELSAHRDRSGRVATVRNLHLTFVGDPSTSVVVAWSTRGDTLASEVRFGESPDRLDRIAQGYSFGYPGVRGRRQHEVHLCGLEPGRTYFYEAGGSGARSRVYRFVTAPDGNGTVRIAVAGDSRTYVDVWRAVARQIVEQAPDVLIFSGDAVGSGISQARWDAFFRAATELLATTPTLWVHGNHEDLATPYFAQFALPENGSGRGHEQWYALTYGPARIIVLNDSLGGSAAASRAQTAFLAETLAKVDRRRTPFVITAHHRPMYTSSAAHVSNVLARREWGPLFDDAGVDVDIAGHVHAYESTLPLRGDGEVTLAGGTRYFTFGGAGAPLYRFATHRPWSAVRERVHGFALMTVSRHTLEWSAQRLDGSLIERLTLHR